MPQWLCQPSCHSAPAPPIYKEDARNRLLFTYNSIKALRAVCCLACMCGTRSSFSCACIMTHPSPAPAPSSQAHCLPLTLALNFQLLDYAEVEHLRVNWALCRPPCWGSQPSQVSDELCPATEPIVLSHWASGPWSRNCAVAVQAAGHQGAYKAFRDQRRQRPQLSRLSPRPPIHSPPPMKNATCSSCNKHSQPGRSWNWR